MLHICFCAPPPTPPCCHDAFVSWGSQLLTVFRAETLWGGGGIKIYIIESRENKWSSSRGKRESLRKRNSRNHAIGVPCADPLTRLSECINAQGTAHVCFQEKNAAPPRCSGRLSARRRPKDRTGPLPGSDCGNSAGSSHIRLTQTEKAAVLKGPNRSVLGGKNQLWLYCCCHFVLCSSS